MRRAAITNPMSRFSYNRLKLILPTALVLAAGYQLTNRWHWHLPALLPLTPLERAIPFWPWTVWPYLVLALSVLLPCGLRDDKLLRRTLAALVCAEALNFLVYLIFPTVYPRPAAADLQHAGTLTAFACQWLWQLDPPNNCFPSGHITGPALGYWALAQAQPRWRGWLWTLFALLALSTLTTKQHYLVDLPAGLLTAGLGLWLSRKFTAVDG